MSQEFYIAAEPPDDTEGQGGGGSGGGPDDPGNFTRRAIQIHGFITLLFGVALGLTLLVLKLCLYYDWLGNPMALSWIDGTDSLTLFLIGFVGGSLFSGFYNLLMFRRLNFFGLGRLTN